MASYDKDFVVKNGLVVQGIQGTISGKPILTTASSIGSLQDVNLTGIQNTNVLAYQNGVFVPSTGGMGLQGIQGIAGYVGSDGAQGIQGIQGIQGTIGDKGIVAQATPPTNTNILWLDTTINYSQLTQRKHDWVSGSSTAYESIAEAGILTSQAFWKITKIVVNNDGTATVSVAYNAIWDNRYTETYT